MDGIESKRRNRPVEETVAVWQEMLKGSPTGTQNCLRFKMDMQVLDPSGLWYWIAHSRCQLLQPLACRSLLVSLSTLSLTHLMRLLV